MATTSNDVAAWTTIVTLGTGVRPINPVIAVAHTRNSASSMLVSISSDGKIDLRETGLSKGSTLEVSVTFVTGS